MCVREKKDGVSVGNSNDVCEKQNKRNDSHTHCVCVRESDYTLTDCTLHAENRGELNRPIYIL